MTENVQFDYRKLRGKMVEKYGSVAAFCNAIGKNRSALYERLNKGASMNQKDILTIANALDIEDYRYAEYFFTTEVKKS